MSYQGNWKGAAEGHRIHIFGPSGAGTSTLGRQLADALATQHFDTDDFYWLPTTPPFRVKRPVEDRLALMEAMFLPRRDWILSGSLDSWGGRIPERFTYAIRLTLDPELRRLRLERREAQRCNCHRGWGQGLCPECLAFLSWADGYEAGDRPGRSLARHVEFARTLHCPVLVMDAARPVKDLVRDVLARLDHGVTVP